MSAILPTSQQLINAAWAYGFIAATACGLMLAWVITSCLLDRHKSRFFDEPTPHGTVLRYEFKFDQPVTLTFHEPRRESLSASALGKARRIS